MNSLRTLLRASAFVPLLFATAGLHPVRDIDPIDPEVKCTLPECTCDTHLDATTFEHPTGGCYAGTTMQISDQQPGCCQLQTCIERQCAAKAIVTASAYPGWVCDFEIFEEGTSAKVCTGQSECTYNSPLRQIPCGGRKTYSVRVSSHKVYERSVHCDNCP